MNVSFLREPLTPLSTLLRRYGCPLLFVVGVDDENRSCILGQGLLRSECTQTFEWFLNNYVTAAGGRKPKVRSRQSVECLLMAVTIRCLYVVNDQVRYKITPTTKRAAINVVVLCLYASPGPMQYRCDV